MKFRSLVVILSFFFLLRLGGSADCFEGFEQLTGKHFIVYYASVRERAYARKILNKAESYYRKIGSSVGYTRYSKFWTWEDRAKIIIFPSQNAFMQFTGQKNWSLGFADRDQHVFHSHAILTYQQEFGAMEDLLPHEISHLILHDFIPDRDLPVWLDEGLAQVNETDKKAIVLPMLQSLVKRNKYIPFSQIMRANIRHENDPQLVTLFYAQSLMMVEFLKQRYGAGALRKMFRQLKDGKPVMDAIQNISGQKIRSVEDFETHWKKFIMQ